jgi:hypothetical protein
MTDTTPTAADLQATPQAEIKPPPNVAKATQSAPAKAEGFAEKMRRLGGDAVFDDPGVSASPDDGGTGGAVDETVSSGGEKAVATEKGAPEKPKAEAKPEAAKLEQLRSLASELGLTLEDTKVTTVERAKLREDRRNSAAALQKAEQDAIQRITDARKSLEADLSRAKSVLDAHQSGNPDAIAKALGHDDWNKMQEHFLSHAADPNYRKLRELEEWQQKQVAESKAREEREAAQRQHQEQIQAQQAYRAQLSGRMRESQDKLVGAMHDDPLFVNAIFSIQQQHYRSYGEEISPEQAASMRAPNGRTLRDEMRTLYDRLSKSFVAAAPEPAPKPVAPPPKPKKSGAETPPPPRPSRLDRRDDRAWMRNAVSRFAEASIEEQRAERRNGSAGE